MKKSHKLLVAECPSCAAYIYFNKRPNLRDIVVCNECDENLEVIRLSPITLDWSLLGDDEDWVDLAIDDYEDGYERSDGYEWN